MKVRHIVTLPGMSMREKVHRVKDEIDFQIARKLPKNVRYWVIMIALGNVVQKRPLGFETTLDDILLSIEFDR